MSHIIHKLEIELIFLLSGMIIAVSICLPAIAYPKAIDSSNHTSTDHVRKAESGDKNPSNKTKIKPQPEVASQDEEGKKQSDEENNPTVVTSSTTVVNPDYKIEPENNGSEVLVNNSPEDVPELPRNKEEAKIAGELLVKFKADVDADTIAALNAEQDTRIKNVISQLNVYCLEILSGAPVDDVLTQYNALPQVEYAEPNYEVKALGN